MQCLAQCRKDIASALSLDEQSLELSMGMSGDYERAVSACCSPMLAFASGSAQGKLNQPHMQVEMGSTNVRVGSTIFGARDYENKR